MDQVDTNFFWYKACRNFVSGNKSFSFDNSKFNPELSLMRKGGHSGHNYNYDVSVHCSNQDVLVVSRKLNSSALF